jgi:catechol 2,3-dioxygenase-like lactoylglutathione lyase family enzyme
VIAVDGLTRIVLVCRDAGRLAEFYREAFGFIPIDKVPKADLDFAALIGLSSGRAWMTMLALGGQRMALAQVTPAGRDYPEAIAGYDLIFQHFAIVVSDMDFAFAGLRRLPGWTAISIDGPQTLPASSGGVTAFKFRDPEGHPLELLAFPPDNVPAYWASRSGNVCLGIDHSAISVADTAKSSAFYNRLGLQRVAGSLNTGADQQRLDDVVDAVVEVTALAPSMRATPHVELLCYRGHSDRRKAVIQPTDVAATQLVFAVAREVLDDWVERNGGAICGGPVLSQTRASRVLLRDPDGHLLCLEASPS